MSLNLTHYMRKEVSGLAFTTLELAEAEQSQGHVPTIIEPNDGTVLYGSDHAGLSDVDLIHSQFPTANYHTKTPKVMWMHGEPISSVGNNVSMKAICDLAPVCDAFICMRKDEWSTWNLIKRTYLVPKGINLDVFKPLSLTEAGPKLSGSPSVLYMEHWRGSRNPLPLVVAMQIVWKKYPKARLHLYNCTDKRMADTFDTLIKQAKLFHYVRSLKGPVPPAEVNTLLNQVDIVVSCLTPLYARSIEAFGAGKAFISPGYTDPEYPWHCTIEPESIAQAIIDCWENYDRINYRKWAEDHHDVKETVRQSIDVYRRYL